MLVPFHLDDLTKIQGILEQLSEPAFVDVVECHLEVTPRAAVAVFKCEHYGECIVSKFLDDEVHSLSEEELRQIAHMANDELDRIVMSSGWALMTDHDVDLGHAHIPDGYKLEFRPILN